MFKTCNRTLSGYQLRMRRSPSKYDRELKSEERRALIWLGLLAVVVTFYFWLRNNDPNSAPYINFFCNSPCPHVTLYWLPFLETLIFYWIGYAGCMLIYFSEDFFHKWGYRGWFVRQAARKIGHVFISAYPGAFVIFPLFGALSIFVPFPLQLPYWLFVFYFVLVLGLWYFERLTGQRNLVGQFFEPSYNEAKKLWRKIRGLREKLRLHPRRVARSPQ